jgi:2-oxoglutarate ferredoxin oxidoreductase subunit gamma
MVDLASVEKAVAAVVGKKKPELYELNLAAVRKGLGR